MPKIFSSGASAKVAAVLRPRKVRGGVAAALAVDLVEVEARAACVALPRQHAAPGRGIEARQLRRHEEGLVGELEVGRGVDRIAELRGGVHRRLLLRPR